MNNMETILRSVARNAFCKVCKDAGKSEKEYTSHYVKDRPGPNGVVVCPLLLSLECRYCHAKGHTPKCCPVILARNVTSDYDKKKAENRCWELKTLELRKTKNHRDGPFIAHPTPLRTKPTNMFSLLVEDDEDEDEDEFDIIISDEPTPEFPPLTNKAIDENKEPTLSGWAMMAAKEAIKSPQPDEVPMPSISLLKDVLPAMPNIVCDNWADDCQTDEDEDEDEDEDIYNCETDEEDYIY